MAISYPEQNPRQIARATIHTSQGAVASQRPQTLLWLGVLAIGGGLAVLWLLFALARGETYTLLRSAYVALPALAIVIISLFFVVTLWKRDGVLPVFELGTVCVTATALYSFVPLLNFMAMGLTWTFADGRLLAYNPSPEEVGSFAWRHVLYLLSFVAAYLYVRGTASVRQAKLEVSLWYRYQHSP